MTEQKFLKYCNVCFSKFTPQDKYTYTCIYCNTIKNKISSQDYKTEEIYSDLELEVEYEVDEIEHSGYCSDPGEQHRIIKKTNKIFKIPKFFKKEHLCGNSVKLDSDPLKYYKIHPKCHGYCNLYSYYNITSAKIRKKNELCLDD